ncbi:exodeoxyribonuclease VII small subunit [Aporhodopirellula aestuarii]|uniref:Exodeoxyribonuclease 7 small subunit n=1 Tax=Aporhodopirellula aestuarii TaxID=2950107 RepID=A0ABT0UEE0_9BACT|nr:exodeoxyribonuclease VII small subunit [Aporhodopirellula aestuarii]MCM2375111.1 exodeoxyribonuclease VII small subunit [Aporhodopirellula aestuarii]
MVKKKTAARPDQNAEAAESESAAEKPDFEETLSEIETIVRKLESGELSLDDSLRQYESAVGKMRQCYRLLEIAERRVSVLSGFDADGNPVTTPLDDAGDGQGNDAETLLDKQKTRGRRRGVAASEPSETDDEEWS